MKMTQEEKQVLLKDLCARLPYGVKMTDGVDTYRLTSPFLYKYIEMELKPYLRPMSSMTEEEKEELYAEQAKDESIFLNIINHSQMGDDSLLGTGIPHHAEDWANKNHFDYRGLIPMGLALEAKEEMYKNE